MSDFDVVLERLLAEPSFCNALAADPDSVLAGYRLDAGEVEVLRSQYCGDTCADSAKVETRTNKSSTFGLLAPFAAMGGLADAVGHHLSEPGRGTFSGLGDAPGVHEGFGSAPASGTAGGVPMDHSGFGAAPDHDGAVSRLGDAPRAGFGGPHHLTGHAEDIAAPKGYHNQVDADGDGHFDRATYTGRAGGGVDIHVDLNGDGRDDFVGHDVNADNRVDFADYDKDHDGVFEKRMYDDDGDGWLDRTVRRKP
jgi:hypothetical protein